MTNSCAGFHAARDFFRRVFQQPSGFYTQCMAKVPVCGLKLERAARKLGFLRIAGLDEVGRGPMFGPVVAAAVILPNGCPPGGPERLQAAGREKAGWSSMPRSGRAPLHGRLRRWSGDDRPHQHPPGVAAGHAPGSRAAGAEPGLSTDRRHRHDRLALPAAVRSSGRWDQPVDCRRQRAGQGAPRPHAGGTRQPFPGYGLARHKGYCSAEHLEALARLGPTPLHRKSFSPVAQVSWNSTETARVCPRRAGFDRWMAFSRFTAASTPAGSRSSRRC